MGGLTISIVSQEQPFTLSQYKLKLDDNPVTTKRKSVTVRVHYPAIVSKIAARATT